MENEFKIEIPLQLRNNNIEFIRLKDKAKTPIECWSKVNYIHNNPLLVNHLALGSNYAVKTGNGLIVVDCDNAESVEKASQLPETFTVKTSKGKHFYFWAECPKSHHKEGLDIQSNGAYVVAPNSIHPDGLRYEVINDRDIQPIDIGIVGSAFNIDLCKVTNTITKTNTTTKTILHSDTVSDKDSEVIDIFKDERFQTLEYYIREGISFIQIDDISQIFPTQRYINGETREYYKTIGNVVRSPNDFGGIVDILLSRGAIHSIRMLPNRSKTAYNFIFYRASERLYSCVNVEYKQFLELLDLSESEIIESFPEFKKASKSKLANIKKNKSFPKIIERMLDGYADNSLTDEMIIPLTQQAVEIGKTDEEIHNLHKIYFKERYNETETEAQLKYAKKKK